MSLFSNSTDPSSPSIFRQIRYTIQADGVQMIIGFVTSILLVRYLGPEGNGALTKLTYGGNLLVAIASFQFFRGVPYLAHQFDSRSVRQWVSLGILFTMLLAFIFLSIDYFFLHLFTWENSLILNSTILLYLLLNIGQKSLESYIQVKRAFDQYWYFQWVAALVKLILVAGMYFGLRSLSAPHRTLAGILFSLTGYFVLIFLAGLRFNLSLKFNLPSKEFITRAFQFAGYIWGITLLSLVLINMNIWYIENYLTQDELGVFGLAISLSGVPFAFTLAIKKALLPYLIEYDRTPSHYLSIIRLHNFALLLICILTGIAGFYLIPLVYGKSFTSASWLLPILLVWTYSNGVFNLLLSLYEGRNRLKWPFNIMLIITLGFYITSYWLLPDKTISILAITYAFWGVLSMLLMLYGTKSFFKISLRELLKIRISDFNNLKLLW